jgi:hypothetical protein
MLTHKSQLTYPVPEVLHKHSADERGEISQVIVRNASMLLRFLAASRLPHSISQAIRFSERCPEISFDPVWSKNLNEGHAGNTIGPESMVQPAVV